jgi:regulator of sigma D
MNAENAIENFYRKLIDGLSNEYEELYESIGNKKLRILFSTLHTSLLNLFDSMNDRLPTVNESAHFWADPSRELIQAIEIIESLERSLKKSDFSFCINEYYRASCKTHS